MTEPPKVQPVCGDCRHYVPYGRLVGRCAELAGCPEVYPGDGSSRALPRCGGEKFEERNAR